MLRINGEDPFAAVNENAKIKGGNQALGTHQNLYDSLFLAWSWYEIYVRTSFFLSYSLGVTGWQYSMGNLALLAHPLVDDVELTVTLRREKSSVTDIFKVFPSYNYPSFDLLLFNF